MARELHDRIRDCVIDCTFYWSRKWPDVPSRETVERCIGAMSTADLLELHAEDKASLKDATIRSYFYKHGLL